MITLLKKKSNKGKNLIALIDGEHYPQVTNDAIKMLKKIYSGNLKGLIFLGGTEKLVIGDIEDFFKEKVYIIKDIDKDFNKALKYFNPDLVYDLSDEPVVDHIKRMKIASYCLANNCSYMGPDFLFSSENEDIHCKKFILSIIGTGKRIGKTAISSYVTKIYAGEGIDVCVIAMGRGGPETPVIIRGDKIDITPRYLLEISNKGMHASSDYIEDALTSRVTTIGCRRCGGGFGGKIFMSNIKEGIKIAEKLNPDLIIVEGSGASIPDVKTDAVICVVGAYQDWNAIVGYLGIYRILSADLIMLTMCEEPMASQDKIIDIKREIKKINPDAVIMETIFRPQPLSDIAGKKIFMGMTSNKIIEPVIKNYMENNFKCRIKKISFNLGNRAALRKDLKKTNDYDTIVTELKAASVDILTDHALRHEKEIVYMNNVPIVKGRKGALEAELKKIFSGGEKSYDFKK